MSRRLYLLIAVVALMLLLTGCSTNPAQHMINYDTWADKGIWDKFFVYPLSYALDWIANAAWGQYGISILIVTIVIRCLILPLTLKQYKSSKQMQAIQPELKKIKEKYKDDAKKQQEETMKLFQKNGVNPLAGCFPLIVQMPVLIALYNSIIRNPEIKQHAFLWMQLGEKDPYYILPILAAGTTFLQQKMMSNQMTPQMQSLMFIFPVLIFVMAMNFASALPLYWIYSNTFTIVQSYFIYGGSKANKAGSDLSK